ncbi:Uncharacterized protein TPAR_06727 [Tolypocladium paradoxum]|uniref:DH domain-containing protein n=1 Tax=Tolypocladium paradoxum TaxID=94208 RepID=A0A2S4KSD7_9HYPO|nr:Uncharacterized protein TPAR_06727 [Tolypocladium paradoxum]
MSVVESPESSLRSSIHETRQSIQAESPIEDEDMSLEGNSPQANNDQDVPTSGLDNLQIQGIDSLETSDSIENIGDTLKAPGSAEGTIRARPRVSIEPCDKPAQNPSEDGHLQSPRPFQRWMRSLHRKARQRPSLWGSTPGTLPRWFSGPEHEGDISPRSSLHRQSSSSGSSFRFVSAVRSASVSLASVSIMARSKRNTALSQCVSRTDRSSRASMSGPRVSEDSAMHENTDAIDAAATERSLQRRRILEELISTEEGYIGDIRFLMNVYVTILASLPSLCMGLRSSINQNLTEIVELHEEILGELHRVVPHSEYTQLEVPSCVPNSTDQGPSAVQGHRRWASLDAAPGRNNRGSWLQHIPGMLSETHVAAEVSKVFAKKVLEALFDLALLSSLLATGANIHQMNRFFIYKEYGAKYEMMIKDVASANQTMPQWETYQRGLEALASILDSAKNAEERCKKALTIGDLLIKPIQRVCRYPLLFAELLKYTPISDCPNSHMEIDSVLTRMREVTAEINRSTNDSLMKATLERTWLLQDRLVFPNKRLDAASKNRVRSFGHIRLCGTLHVCWQSPRGVDGQYLICLLYRDVLCLASAGRGDLLYVVQACINLNRARIEDVDNGRGLQCHTAPFSWKLVFECDHHLYETIMTACTPKEEMEWRARLSRPVRDSSEPTNSGLFSSLDLDIKSLGTVFGKPGTIARRISIHRATTVGPKAPLCQVVLKNTSVVRDTTNNSSTSLTINRSQSLLTTNARMPVLAPARSERARLEAFLADVWSREILPFPGMTTRARSEHLVRTSASTVMRKLSVASITSSFTKRSGSLSQKSKPNEDANKAEASKRRGWKSSTDDTGPGYKMGNTDTVRRTKRPRTRQGGDIESKGEASDGELPATRGTVRRDQIAKTATEVGEAIALRASSANSLRLGQSARCEKAASRWVEKENTCPGAKDKTPSWGRQGKVNGTKNDGGSLGFMNIFR